DRKSARRTARPAAAPRRYPSGPQAARPGAWPVMKTIPDILLRYMEGLKTHDVERIAGTVADDLALITPAATLSKERFLNMLRALYAAFPDWHYDPAPPEVRGESFAVRWRQRGTHTGTFVLPGLEPVPPSGKAVRIPEQHFFYRVRNGLIVE